MLLESLNWSARAESFFENVSIETIDQLLAKTPSEVLRYRNVGTKTLIEIRLRLGKVGLSLKDDKVYVLDEVAKDHDHLIQRKMALEVELSAIKQQLEEIAEAKALEQPIAPPLDEDAIYKAWQGGKTFTELARLFSTRQKVVSDICWAKLEADCIRGTPPVFSRKIERHFCCRSCGGAMVARYINEPKYPKCPFCGRTSKSYFK